MTYVQTIGIINAMRQTNVRTFYKNFFKEVEDLPVEVTRYGVAAFVVSKGEKIPEKIEEEHNRVIEPGTKCALELRRETAVGYGDYGTKFNVPLCERHLK